MQLNELGEIAMQQWLKLPDRFPSIELGAFVVMPNHIHGIIIINEDEAMGAEASPAQTNIPMPAQNTPKQAPALGDIVGAYKSLVARDCLQLFKSKNETLGKLWQRNYYEHIIRNQESFEKIAEYIENNPITWQQDELFEGELI